MRMNTLFEKALAIQYPWFIKEIRFDQGQKQLDIFIDFCRGATFVYADEESGSKGEFKAYDAVNKIWRHLNFFEHECSLHCRTPRVKTDDGKIHLITPPWAGLNSGFTLLFEALILQLCSHMPVHSVGRIIGETDAKLWRLLESYTERGREEAGWSKVNTVGMDETGRAKGHEYITLFVDMGEKRTLHVGAGKGSETVKEFASELAKRDIDPTQVKQVSCDMSPAFIKGVRENLPQAGITFDKFHILKVKLPAQRAGSFTIDYDTIRCLLIPSNNQGDPLRVGLLQKRDRASGFECIVGIVSPRGVGDPLLEKRPFHLLGGQLDEQHQNR